MGLLDRFAQREALDQLLAAARQGLSGVLVMRGEPGVGKTALLDYAIESADSLQVARVAGVEAERELGFAGLHRLLVPFLPRAGQLPPPQRDALGSAFGLVAGVRADLFLVGLAVLTLLADSAADQPLLCVCDDVQWLDTESLAVLAFVGRRLHADRIAMLFGVRDSGDGTAAQLDGLPGFQVGGLPEKYALELLASTAGRRLDARVARRIVAETGGNPLAITELAADVTTDPVAASSPLSQRLPLGELLERRFVRQVRSLPPDAQVLLLVAAADPTGDPDLLWRAAAHLEVTGGAVDLAGAAREAEAAGLMVLRPVPGFRHPLIRSGIYGAATGEQRRLVHRALAAVTSHELDPDRRAWHFAAASAGPDEQVAAELERSAARAESRGGASAQAAFLSRAADLTPDRDHRAARLFRAAAAALAAGAPQSAQVLLERAAPDLDGRLSQPAPWLPPLGTPTYLSVTPLPNFMPTFQTVAVSQAPSMWKDPRPWISTGPLSSSPPPQRAMSIGWMPQPAMKPRA